MPRPTCGSVANHYAVQSEQMDRVFVALAWAAVVLLSFGGVSAIAASRRRHNPVLWYLIGSVLGPIGLVLALRLTPRQG